MTGLSAPAKSTIANIIDGKLFAAGHHTMLLDGDNDAPRASTAISCFNRGDRVENIRRAGEVAKLMMQSGLIVLCRYLAYKSDREWSGGLVADGEFLEVLVDTPIGNASARDPKGLYSKAKAGKIKNFYRIDAPYEAPEAPEIRLTTVVSNRNSRRAGRKGVERTPDSGRRIESKSCRDFQENPLRPPIAPCRRPMLSSKYT